MFVGVDAVERFGKDLDCLLERVRAGEMPLARLRDLITASRSVEAKMAVLQTEAARLIAWGSVTVTVGRRSCAIRRASPVLRPAGVWL